MSGGHRWLVRGVVVVAVLSLSGAVQARSLDFWESYSGAAYGGLENTSFYTAGLQLMTLGGPGDSSLLGGHLGVGLDAAYVHLGESGHFLRLQPTVELLLLCLLYVQAGVGADVALENPAHSAASFSVGVGLRLFLGDEYQSPSLSLGGRFDWSVGTEVEFVPSAMGTLTFYLDP